MGTGGSVSKIMNKEFLDIQILIVGWTTATFSPVRVSVKLFAHVLFLKKERWPCTQVSFVCLQLCEKVEVHFVPGNHVTMLDKKETAAIINRPVAAFEHQWSVISIYCPDNSLWLPRNNLSCYLTCKALIFFLHDNIFWVTNMFQ
jgi:hypothetical protein